MSAEQDSSAANVVAHRMEAGFLFVQVENHEAGPNKRLAGLADGTRVEEPGAVGIEGDSLTGFHARHGRGAAVRDGPMRVAQDEDRRRRIRLGQPPELHRRVFAAEHVFLRVVERPVRDHGFGTPPTIEPLTRACGRFHPARTG